MNSALPMNSSRSTQYCRLPPTQSGTELHKRQSWLCGLLSPRTKNWSLAGFAGFGGSILTSTVHILFLEKAAFQSSTQLTCSVNSGYSLVKSVSGCGLYAGG